MMIKVSSLSDKYLRKEALINMDDVSAVLMSDIRSSKPGLYLRTISPGEGYSLMFDSFDARDAALALLSMGALEL